LGERLDFVNRGYYLNSKNLRKDKNIMRCEEVYEKLYNCAPLDVAFCPYRISPLGAHIDHQWGKINGLAIDKGIHIAYRPKQNGVVEVQSVNFPKRAQFYVNGVEEQKVGDWADHLRGAAKMLGEKHKLNIGLSAVIEGSLPIGGLSSSAAVIICFLSALCKVNNIHLTQTEMIMTAKAAENQYVGVACGKLDQSCEVLSVKDHLLYMDTKDDSFESIPTNPCMKPYKVAVFFSGLERSLANSKYNLRQDECKAAAYALMGYAGMEYGTFAETRLRDVPSEVFKQYGNRLPENWRKRTVHYYNEFARAEAGAELWRKGDLENYGQLVFESGQSSIENYECGCDEMKKLYEIMRDTKGIYGGRFSGAGFKGCCMALINPDYAEEIEAYVGNEYLKAYPALEGRYSFHLCESADGVSI
jgi:galactokinase/galacturonokinase